MLNQSLVSFNEEVNDLLSTGYCDQAKLSAAFKNVENVNTFIPFWDSKSDKCLLLPFSTLLARADPQSMVTRFSDNSTSIKTMKLVPC